MNSRVRRTIITVLAATCPIGLFTVLWCCRNVSAVTKVPLSQNELAVIADHFGITLLAVPKSVDVWFSSNTTWYSLHVRMDFMGADPNSAYSAGWFITADQVSAVDVEAEFASPVPGFLAEVAQQWQPLPTLASDVCYRRIYPSTGPVESTGLALIKSGPSRGSLYLVRTGMHAEVRGRLLTALTKEPIDIGLVPSESLYTRSGLLGSPGMPMQASGAGSASQSAPAGDGG